MRTVVQQPPCWSRTPAWAIAIFAAYAAAVTLLSADHAVSRDEMRALSLTRAADNPVDLVRTRLVDEGHPALWYLVLWAGSCISSSTVVLKAAAVLIALIYSGLFFFRSPFPLAHRILFLFGYLPLFLYSVMARNYGISAVFMFLIALEHSRPRESSPWIVGLCNALLANTNIYGSFCAIAFMLLPWRFPNRSWREQLRAQLIVVVLTGLGGLALAYTVWPSGDNLINPGQSGASGGMPALNGSRLAEAFISAGTDESDWVTCILTGCDAHSKARRAGFGRWLRFFDVAGLLAVVLLLRASAPRVVFLTAFLIAGLFAHLVYEAEDRHICVLTLFLLSLLWIQRAWDGPNYPRFWRCILAALFLVLSAHTVMQLYYTTYRYARDPYSQTKNAGQFLATVDPSTILICEPDYYGDALPYYASNDIYVVREGRFRSYVSFNASYRKTITLKDLLEAAERLEKDTGRKVLVSLQMPVSQFENRVYDWGLGKKLKILPDQVSLFRERFREVAVFDGKANEMYVFYELRNDSQGQ